MQASYFEGWRIISPDSLDQCLVPIDANQYDLQNLQIYTPITCRIFVSIDGYWASIPEVLASAGLGLYKVKIGATYNLQRNYRYKQLKWMTK